VSTHLASNPRRVQPADGASYARFLSANAAEIWQKYGACCPRGYTRASLPAKVETWSEFTFEGRTQRHYDGMVKVHAVGRQSTRWLVWACALLSVCGVVGEQASGGGRAYGVEKRRLFKNINWFTGDFFGYRRRSERGLPPRPHQILGHRPKQNEIWDDLLRPRRVPAGKGGVHVALATIAKYRPKQHKAVPRGRANQE